MFHLTSQLLRVFVIRARARENRRRGKAREDACSELLAPFIHAAVNLAGIKVKYEISRTQRGAAPRMYPLPRSHAFSWRKFVPPFSTCKLECMARPRTRKEEGEKTPSNWRVETTHAEPLQWLVIQRELSTNFSTALRYKFCTRITTRERPSRGFLDEEQQRLIPSRALYEFIAKSDREISRFARLASKFISARSELNLRVDMRYSDRCVVNYASCCWN